MAKWIHRLSSVNEEKMVGQCAHCGFVELVRNSGGRPACKIAYQESGRRPRPDRQPKAVVAARSEAQRKAQELWSRIQAEEKDGWRIAFVKDGEVREIYIL